MTEEVGRKFTRVRHIQMLADKCVETFATKAQLENAINSIPTKVSQLTNDTNFATVDQVTSTVESNGGKINTIKINGTAVTIDSGKAVDITIPTKVSQLTNDSNFVTSSGITSITCNGSTYNTATAALGALVKSVTCSGTSVTPTAAGVLTINPVMNIVVNGTTVNPSSGTATLTTQIQAMIDNTVGTVVTNALAASY